MRRGFSEESSAIMVQSISEKTIKQYEKPIRLWWSFCQENDIPVYEANTNNVIDFLTKQLNSVKSYSTLNTYRSAISLIMGNTVGAHPDMIRFFKGIANQMPKKAKYSATWDPNIVLKYLSEQGPNEKLGLKGLTKKLVTILALVTGQRVQTLFCIKVNNIIHEDKRIRIKIEEKLKTSRFMKSMPVLEIPYYDAQPNVCPARTLVTYLEKTSDLRPPDEERLILTHQKPYHAATTQTVSRWIKSTLKQSGLNTELYSAHSTRHASTSAAARTGVNVDTILQAIGWSKNSSTFARFYNRPLISEKSFATSILSNYSNSKTM